MTGPAQGYEIVRGVVTRQAPLISVMHCKHRGYLICSASLAKSSVTLNYFAPDRSPIGAPQASVMGDGFPSGLSEVSVLTKTRTVACRGFIFRQITKASAAMQAVPSQVSKSHSGTCLAAVFPRNRAMMAKRLTASDAKIIYSPRCISTGPRTVFSLGLNVPSLRLVTPDQGCTVQALSLFACPLLFCFVNAAHRAMNARVASAMRSGQLDRLSIKYISTIHACYLRKMLVLRSFHVESVYANLSPNPTQIGGLFCRV